VTGVARAQDKILSMDPTQITYEMVSKKLREIVTSRGKKGIDRNEQVEMLVYLATVAKGPCQQVRRSAAAPPRARASKPAQPAVTLWRVCAAASVALWLSCAPV
jgi:translation initiation factor 3 subunit C